MTTTKSMTTAKLLQQRRTAKKRKPYFVVKESHCIKRVKERWRLPRGRHSAARQRYRGRPAQPHPGYSSPKEVRGLSREGLIPVVVHNEKEIQTLKEGVHGLIIAKDVGSKKKLALLALAQEKKIALLQVKDAEALNAKIKDAVVQRQKMRQAKKQEKAKKQVEKRKKTETKKEKTTKKKESETEEKTKDVHSKEEASPEAVKRNEKVPAEVPSTEEEERKLAEKVIIKKQ